MAYFPCQTRIQIRTQTRIPVLCRFVGKGSKSESKSVETCSESYYVAIGFGIRVRIIIRVWQWKHVLCRHRVWNPCPAVEISHQTNGLSTLMDPDSDPYLVLDSCTMHKFHIGSDSDSDPLIEMYVVGTEICL